MTWQVEDDHLVTSELSNKSKNFKNDLIRWLDKHNDADRIAITNAIFKVIEDANIKDLLTLVKLKSIIKVIKNIKNIDDESKKLIFDLLKYNVKEKKD